MLLPAPELFPLSLGPFPGAATLPWHPWVLHARTRVQPQRHFQMEAFHHVRCIFFKFSFLKSLFSAACGQGEVERV